MGWSWSKVFKILDLDDDGTLDADEFLSGCLRLRGPAKTLDVLVARRKVRYFQVVWKPKNQPSPIPQKSGGIGGRAPMISGFTKRFMPVGLLHDIVSDTIGRNPCK